MGNISSRHKYTQLKTTELKETGFQDCMEVSLALYGAKIESVSDESFGAASNLIQQEVVDKDLIHEDSEESTHGWLTKRHEKDSSVTIALCNNTEIAGFDIETTGYIECCPSFASIEGYSRIDFKWHELVPKVPITADSHNFFELTSSYSFSLVRLNVTPGGGIARFRTYGDVTPIWTDEGEAPNLASASFGARIVRWTDRKSANSNNVLLDNGTTMADGWLTPRSKFEQDRNDFIVIKLATVGKLNRIVIDTTGYEYNSPSKITIQGCYSSEIDPYYDSVEWWTILSHQDICPADLTVFDVEIDVLLSHIRVFIIPDGGIQQILVYGTPVTQNRRGMNMIEGPPERKAIESNKENISTDTLFEEKEEVAKEEKIETITKTNIVVKEEEEEFDNSFDQLSKKRVFSGLREPSPPKKKRGRPRKVVV